VIGWAPPHVVALYVGRPVKTIRNWADRGEIPSACFDGRIVVHAGSARQYAETRRTRRATAKQSA
jgi:hypothetical protein